ncbi:hypothetical protein KP509_02G059900 [Ceratopteris richardii]|uniref:Uncharacterized protein n=1 Tax=Ceratopteris richardii TaxID=49495 RepID=A0A8T2VDH6_CERRI|nr:hypothetical protein KP509_02G059900 [Ceratopteris richardii]
MFGKRSFLLSPNSRDARMKKKWKKYIYLYICACGYVPMWADRWVDPLWPGGQSHKLTSVSHRASCLCVARCVGLVDGWNKLDQVVEAMSRIQLQRRPASVSKYVNT